MARNAVRKARAGLVNAEAAVRAAQPLPEGLAALLAEIRADRKPMAHAEEVAAKVEAAAAQVRRCLAMVPGWSGTAEQLRDLAVKGDSAFERLDATVKTMAAAAAEKHAARANLAKQDDFDRRALSTLQRHDLPDASSIASARAERDRGMRLVISRAFGQPPTAGEESAYSGGEPVPVVYERHVRAADSIADRRADELKQVQEAERLGLGGSDGLRKPFLGYRQLGRTRPATSSHRITALSPPAALPRGSGPASDLPSVGDNCDGSSQSCSNKNRNVTSSANVRRPLRELLRKSD